MNKSTSIVVLVAGIIFLLAVVIWINVSDKENQEVLNLLNNDQALLQQEVESSKEAGPGEKDQSVYDKNKYQYVGREKCVACHSRELEL